jgi:hypothetical protein
MRTNVARSWAGPALLLVVVALFYWKLVLTNQFTWMEGPDTSNLILPWLQFQAGEWHAGRIPLWDPNVWTGQPLLGQGQPGGAYPLNWLLFLAPLHHGWLRQDVLHWYFVAIRMLAALTAYALCRDLGRSRIASMIAGCVFALGGYLGHNDFPQKTNGAVWAPLVLMFMLRAERGQRPIASAVLSGFFLGVVWLSGHHEVPVFLTLAVVGLWTWLSVRGGRMNWDMARLAAVSLAIAVLASAVQTLPTAQYGSESVRWIGEEEPVGLGQSVPYRIHQQYSLKPIALLGVIIPGVEFGSDPYVGIAAIALALLGLALGWRQPYIRWLAMISLAAILFALGPNSILHGILYSVVPLVEKARVPGAATLIFALGLAPLIAYGVDFAGTADSSVWTRRGVRVLLAVAAVLALASLLFYAAKVPLAISDDRLMITVLGAALAAAILAGWSSHQLTRRAGGVALLWLILFELANVTNYWLPHARDAAQNPYLHRMAEHADLVTYVRSRGEAGRIEYDATQIPYNIGDWFGIETFNAYAASVPANLWRNDVFSPRVRDILGVKYYFAKGAPRPNQKEVFQGKSGVKVFENGSVFPRVWAVHEASVIEDLKVAKATLANPAFDARNKVFLIGGEAPALACAGSDDEVEMPVHHPDRVEIRARLGCRGMVILSDNWFPGWIASVDGDRAKIHEAYGFLRGVVVEAGEHTIEMRYLPGTVVLGGLMTLSAAILAFVLGRRAR